MFTGIIQDIGIVEEIEKTSSGAVLKVRSEKICGLSKLGESISVNGACLTISKLDKTQFQADVLNETLKRTNLGTLLKSSKVNLEQALTPTSLLGGHWVQGHVDGIGVVQSLEKAGEDHILTVKPNEEIMKYLVPQASIAINGTSLTIAHVLSYSLVASIIPTTYKETNIHLLKKSDPVNIEVDMIGKYIYHYVHQPFETKKSKKISEEFLREHGF
ncbi:MAG: riboflavin synthase [Candidatus Margulisbacteria bacterium]|nr:riboflavin synthase [Candidatus Margulisiibacteriota bacterium]